MEVFYWFVDRLVDLFDFLRGIQIAGISFLTIVFGGLVLSMVVTVFWRGARG